MVYTNKKTKWKIIMISVRGWDECPKRYPQVSKFCVLNHIEFDLIDLADYDSKKWEFTPDVYPAFILQKNGETVLKISGYNGEFTKIEKMIL